MAGSFWLDESTSIRYTEGRAFSYGEGEDRINYTAGRSNAFEPFAELGLCPSNKSLIALTIVFTLFLVPTTLVRTPQLQGSLNDEPAVDPATGELVTR